MGQEEMLLGGIGLLVVVYLAFVLAIFVLTIVVAWRITAKTGYPGALGLLWLVPLINVIFLLVLAFSEWPIEKELRALRDSLAARETPPGI